MYTSSKHSPGACHQRSSYAPLRGRGYQTRSSTTGVSIIRYRARTVITHEDDDTETTSGKQQVDPRLDLVNLNVVTGRDNTRLVQAAVELDNDLARTVVIDDLELAIVAYKN